MALGRGHFPRPSGPGDETRTWLRPKADAATFQWQKLNGHVVHQINQSNNAKGILTGKFFEYLAARRPVLAIGPVDGDIAAILKETGAGSIIDFYDKNGLMNELENLFAKFEQGSLNLSSVNYLKYSRRELTGRLTEIFNDLLKCKK